MKEWCGPHHIQLNYQALTLQEAGSSYKMTVTPAIPVVVLIDNCLDRCGNFTRTDVISSSGVWTVFGHVHFSISIRKENQGGLLFTSNV